MNCWNLYDKTDGSIKGVVTRLEYNGSWMGECYVNCSIQSAVPVDFRIGDFIVYREECFELNYNPEVSKQAEKRTHGAAFVYENIKFNSFSDELTRCDFLDVVRKDNGLHFTGLPVFSFYASSVKDLADRIQANLDRLYAGENRWTVEVHEEYSTNSDVNIQVNNLNTWKALALSESKFGAHFIIRGRTIIIGTAGLPADHLFRMGKGNGLKKLTKTAESDQQIVTRLRVYGSTRNLPRRYYNSLSGADGTKFVPDNMAVQNLMLPGFPEDTLDPCLDSPNIASLGIREGTVFFDGSDEEHPEIFPSIEEMTADQLTAAGIATTATGRLDELAGAGMVTDNGVGTEEGNEIVPDTDTFTVKLKDVGFDINDYWTDETPMLSFKSGMLGGREFEIVTEGKQKPVQNADKTWTLTLKRVYDESLQLFFPYSAYNAKEGDRFVLLHIYMPDTYIKTASQRLREAGLAYLTKNDYSRSVYNPEVDNVFMAQQHQLAQTNPNIRSLHDTIKEGDLLVFEDEDLLIGSEVGGASVFIDKLIIKEGSGPIPTYEVTLRNEKSVGTIEKIQNQIDSIKGGQGNGGYTAAQIKQLIQLYGGDYFLSKKHSDRTPYDLSIGGMTHAEGGARFGSFVSGMSGGQVDRRGNAEFESGIFRSFLQIYELIVNRQRTLEGDVFITEGDTIEEVIPLGVSDEGNALYTLKLHPEWEGYTTAQYEGNVIRGVYNNITQHVPDGDGTGQTTVNNATYATSWMRVLTVRPTDNEVDVVMYPDDEVPAGRNFPPRPMMKFARWGNAGGTEEQMRRQTVLYFSSTEGRIMKRFRVTRPIVGLENVSVCIGTLPEGLYEASGNPILKDVESGGYFETLVVQNLIQLDHQGLPKPEITFRGDYDPDADYYDGTAPRPDTGVYEWSCVVYYGCQWLCLKPGTRNPPSWDSIDWMLYLGDPRLRLEWDMDEYSVMEDNPDITLRVSASIYYQDVTDDQKIHWEWKRESWHDGVQDSASDALWNAAHTAPYAGRNSIHLVREDMNYNFGKHPEKLFYTVTATLVDKTGKAAQEKEAVFGFYE